MKTTKTIQGDTWDILSKRLYGNEMFMDRLIKANIKLRDIVIFPSGVVLQVPEFDVLAAENNLDLPPWKQEG